MKAVQQSGVPEDDIFVTANMGRRSFIRHALVGITGGTITALGGGCSALSFLAGDESKLIPAPPNSTGSNILLVYFSRAGENYYYGGRTQLEVGNTEVLAGKISQRIQCDVYKIEPVDPYSNDYEETVERNVQEQNANARPAIANLPASIDAYDTVLLASPIWNVRAPMIMSTFAERFDFTGKTIYPVTTYAMSGLGTTHYAPARPLEKGLPSTVRKWRLPMRRSKRGCDRSTCPRPRDHRQLSEVFHSRDEWLIQQHRMCRSIVMRVIPARHRVLCIRPIQVLNTT